ncbi:hypothetical protein Apa02nite_021900 [Actinoplanes palleronii]|uniref:GGDEF domain-containing protein n=1 Tax=Actinoplanes palleronii TaxID=113570 RepID=A0ABQ4B5Y4_9ACTN|nr:hypothetical protein Apa02nite_021900 [Actinoplanes palleronii]
MPAVTHGREVLMPGVSVGAVRSRRRTLRAIAVNGSAPALLAAGYATVTWSDPHRGVMLAVAATMVLAGVLLWTRSGRLAGSRRGRLVALLAGSAVTLTGSAVLALLDGGVAGPLGTLVPGSVMLLAIVLPPAAFPVVGAYSALAYAAVVFWGDPAPAGYAVVHVLGFAGSAVLCRRHAAVLIGLRRRLADSSRTDPLTGCLNRRGFDERVAAALAGAERTGEPVTLILLDLDHFKTVNDSHGHRAGDDLLTWAGRELRAGLRGPDAAGRLGGDEFALLLTGTDAGGAASAVDRVRARLNRCAPSSLGSATFPYDATDAAGLSAAADRRLYADKAGRDRHAPSAAAVAEAGAELGEQRSTDPEPCSAPTRKRHAIADPGWMAVAQTGTAAVYVLLFAGGHPHRSGMVALCFWGFATGLALVAGADRLSRSRLARPLMLAFAVSSFLSCAAIAALDGGVAGPLGIGMLLAVPLLMLGLRRAIAAPVAVATGALYVTVAVTVGGASLWYVVISLLGTAAVAVATATQGRAAARQRELLTALSRVDALTGVLNRRGFAERFTAESGRARGVALLVFDLDGFKQLNDSAGHAAGDELLRWVAATLRRAAQPHDVVGRLGGDEFVVLLTDVGSPGPTGDAGVPGAIGDTAADAARRLRTALAERTPASVGAAVLDHDGDDFDALYAVADGRLYVDKSDRVRAKNAATSATTQSAARLRNPARNEPVASFTAPSR